MVSILAALWQRQRAWFLSLPPRRLLRHCGFLFLLFLVLSLTLYVGDTINWSGIEGLMLGAMLLSYGALRLQPPNARRARDAFLREAAIAVLQTIPAALLAVVPVVSGRFASGFDARLILSFIVTSALLGVGYLGLRLLTLTAAWWGRVRHRRLTWAFVHSTVLSLLLVALPMILFLLWAVIVSSYDTATPLSPIALYQTSLSTFLYLLIPIIAFVAVMAGVIAVLFVPSLLVSTRIARQTTRRLDALAVMAEQLQVGDLSARVRVEGQDEVARFQQDFNTMADSLERAVLGIKAERERVEGLLSQRRELVATVSHELRTPIAVMHGQLEQMQAHSDHDEHVETLLMESGRLSRLVDDLFTLSRAEVGRLTLRAEPTEVAAVIQHCVQSTAPTAWQQRRVEVVAECPATLPPARADRERLTQILYNLLHNAIRHTDPGGIVAVLAEATPDSVLIHVRDTGEGIPDEALPHIWEPFFRAHPNRPGTGLGLPLVRQLAEAMGGTATVESAVGEGSTFTVTLPRAT